MLKNLLWGILGLLIVVPIIAGLAWLKYSQFKVMGEAAEQMVAPPETVNSFTVSEEQWQPRVSSVGSVTAVRGTMVSTEASGIVREIHFAAASEVTTGALLAQLDVDIENAQLGEAVAAADLTKVSFGRAKQLVESRSIAKAEFDTAAANLRQALARVDNIKALIAKKTVRAPFAGKLGIRNISVGQYLQTGSEVVSLQALDPVYVDFSLPQQRLSDVAEGLQIEVTTDAYPDQMFNGRVTAVNPNIDPSTRNVRIQATLNNADKRLRPGMFAAVDLITSRSETVLFIPETAVQHAAFGDSVFVIENDEKAPDSAATTTITSTTTSLVLRQQIVRLGARQGDFVVVTDGLKAGDKIVSTGVFKLRPATAVVIDNELAPKFSLTPDPENT